MVSRWRRHLDLLQAIDMEPNFNNHPDEHYSVKMRDRPMHKDEIQRLCQFVGLDDSGTVPELRDRIRDEYFDDYTYGSWQNPQETKQGSSQFSTGELRHLAGLVKSKRRLSADEVNIYHALEAWGGHLRIVTEDDEYDVEVVDKSRGHWKDHWTGEPKFSEYEKYMLAGRHFEDGRRHRLMVLHDMDIHRYKGSVVLEQPYNHGPYKRWKQQAYVRELELND